MKVMEHFISLVLMEAGGWGLEEGGIARRGEGSWYQGPIHLPVITRAFAPSEVQPNLLAHLFI